MDIKNDKLEDVIGPINDIYRLGDIFSKELLEDVV